MAFHTPGASLPHGDTTCGFILFAPDGPDVPIISPPDSHFLAGTNLSLFCLAASNPPAQYSWLINGRPQHAAQELSIPNLTANHSGSYTCRVHSSVTGLSRTTVKNITVSGKWTLEHGHQALGGVLWCQEMAWKRLIPSCVHRYKLTPVLP